MSMVYDGAEDAQERVREIADAIKGIISEPNFEESDIRERVESVARVLRLVAERKGVAIDLSGVQDTVPMELDRKAIYNAIYNLINNAIPETPEGGMIMVRTRNVDLEGKPGLEIQVADTGRGMSARVRERMFSESAISTKPGGTGLGTRIVKNVVELHHGTITVDSEEGKGTTFTILIPIKQPRPGEEPTPPPPSWSAATS
jgi:signal transduction histidine kinase